MLVGHDRGVRVADHVHLAHNNSTVHGLKITGLALVDIVPLISQRATGDKASKATGWFHWSFLANPSIAIPMVSVYGGGEWAADMIERWSGNNNQA